MFSLYNAGPNPVIVERHQPMFMIVFADLDRATTRTYKGGANGRSSIDPTLIQGMTSQVFSPLMLQRRIEDLNKKIDEKLTDLNKNLDVKINQAEKSLSNTEKSLSNIRVVTYSVTAVATIVLASTAIFATFAPATLGVIIATIVQQGGFDLRPKMPSEPSPYPSPKPASAVEPQKSGQPTEPLPSQAAKSKSN